MRAWILLLLLLAAGIPALSAADDAPKPPVNDTTPAEAELGRRTAEQIEKEYKLVKDDAALQRLATIVADIVPHTERPGVVYTVKILDVNALNAMAIPGGIIYVTKGLLAAVESDHELAGVLAHEIAHNALRHAKRLAAKEGSISLTQLATIIVAIYANKDGEVPTGQIIVASELLKQALINGYTVEMEIESDDKAMEYLAKTKKYDPNGLYSVILGFRQMEMRRPHVEMGMYKTHPYSDERKKLLEAKMKELGVKINLWNVVNFRADVQPVNDGNDGYQLRLGNVGILTFTLPGDAENVHARAEDAAAAINRRLAKDYLQQFDVSKDADGDTATIRLRWMPVFTVTAADADAAGMTLEAFSAMIVQGIKSSLYEQLVLRN